MKKNIIFLTMLCCMISLRAMDTDQYLRSLEPAIGIVDESSEKTSLCNKTVAGNGSSEKPVVITLSRNLSKKSKKRSNATEIAELKIRLIKAEKRIASLEKFSGVKN